MPNFATPGVIVKDNIIRTTAPMLKKFRGQSEENLKTWAKNHNWEIRETEIPERDEEYGTE